jgi:hypothetical protein
MELYQLSDFQKKQCKESIRLGVEHGGFTKAERDRFIKPFNVPGTSVRTLTIYLGMQVKNASKGGDVDEHFVSHLPKALSDYPVFFDPKSLFGGGYIIPKKDLPLSVKPSPKKLYSFHLDRDVKSQLEARAKAEERTVSGVIRMAIKRYLESS